MNENQLQPTGQHNSLDPKVIALLSYLLWLVGGIVFFATSKDSFVKFHAMQSILFTIFIMIVYTFITIFGFMFWFLLAQVAIIIWTVIFAAWILLMVKAYQGERFKLPLIGKYAEKFSRQV